LIQINAHGAFRAYETALEAVNAMSSTDRPCITDEPMGLPSPEALQLAMGVIRQRYDLPETTEHPQVRSECMRLLI
jgi:hypothetical protein